ncbi:hypothetical protein HN51_020952 [Arachis hypogaea]|uniref:Aminotransferase-like plant mobile domain-containing protein n=1 Tax=Arachis hypogaea TaxID=3818 RepID=A0A445EIN9_ARAHY|nr:hypothetical protein Ahy_A02g009940 [Arachis hypogaea]
MIFSWGSACLAHLYRSLYRTTRLDCKEIDGPLTLLLAWAWIRLPFIAPIPNKPDGLVELAGQVETAGQVEPSGLVKPVSPNEPDGSVEPNGLVEPAGQVELIRSYQTDQSSRPVRFGQTGQVELAGSNEPVGSFELAGPNKPDGLVEPAGQVEMIRSYETGRSGRLVWSGQIGPVEPASSHESAISVSFFQHRRKTVHFSAYMYTS